jgi:hypothetical protein
MIVVIAVLVLVLMVPATGGRLGALAELRLRRPGALVLAIGLQLVITSLAPGGNDELHSAIHVATYGFAAWFVWLNRKIPGMLVIALGGASNTIAIVVNGGVMPASPAALRAADLVRDGDGFRNSAATGHPRLPFLGDVIAIPGPHPIANVVSLGDLVLLCGVLVLLHATCHARGRPAVEDSATWPSTATASASSPSWSKTSSTSEREDLASSSAAPAPS